MLYNVTRGGKMESIMWKYIDETEAVLKLILNDLTATNIYKEIDFEIKEVNIVGSGSSYNAGLNAQVVFNDILNINTNVYTPAKYMMVKNFNKDSLNIFISQTGTSKSSIDALNHASQKELKSLALSANHKDGIVLLADYFVNLNCGEEKSNAKTKGYSATIYSLLNLLLSISNLIEADKDKINILTKELQEIINKVNKIKESAIKFVESNKNLAAATDMMLVASNESVGSLNELSLKLSETMLIPVTFTEGLEFSHGLHRTVNFNSNLLFLLGEGVGKEEVKIAYEYFKDIAKNVVLINNTSDRYNKSDEIVLSGFKYLYSIEQALVIQVFAVYLPEIIGNDPNVDVFFDFVLKSKTRI